MSRWIEICADISAATGKHFVPVHERRLGGGSINEAWLLESSDSQYFVKVNQPQLLDMFEAEAEGLNEISAARAIKVPGVVSFGLADGVSYIAMEYVACSGGRSGSPRLLGEQLAAMHRYTADRYGWHRDNSIGSTPQPNTQSDNWIDFLREQRLGFQLELANRKGASRQLYRKGMALLPELAFFFGDYVPEPSLLHGDLWSGNYAFSMSGEPLIFDPAVYYGDREADIAMTELFGGFPGEFYSAYRESWPLDPGYRQRKTLYNLYHILNHFNLFGGGYEGQAISMLEGLGRALP